MRARPNVGVLAITIDAPACERSPGPPLVLDAVKATPDTETYCHQSEVRRNGHGFMQSVTSQASSGELEAPGPVRNIALDQERRPLCSLSATSAASP